MNIIMSRVSQQSTSKNKKQLVIDPVPPLSKKEKATTQHTQSYDACKDRHAHSYFQQKSVQKHLKQLADVVEKQPKSKKNSNFIRSISQWIKPTPLKEEELRNRSESEKIQNKPSLAKIQTNPSQIKNQKQKIKYKASPYRVFPLFIKIENHRQLKNKASQSTCNLPQIDTPECKVQQVSKIIQNKLSKAGKREKKIDSLHSLKHKQFLQFLNKKKQQLTNSSKLINPEANEERNNEK